MLYFAHLRSVLLYSLVFAPPVQRTFVQSSFRSCETRLIFFVTFKEFKEIIIVNIKMGESYLAEQFRQITHYFAEQFRQIAHYLAEHPNQKYDILIL